MQKGSSHLEAHPIYRVSLLIQLVPDPQNDYSTDNGCTDVAEPAGFPVDAEQTQQPVSYDTADESEKKVYPAAFSLTAGKFSGDKACQNTCDNCFNHNFYYLIKNSFYFYFPTSTLYNDRQAWRSQA